jgi:hypothetical protein
MYANPEGIRKLTRDIGVFATCLFVSVAPPAQRETRCPSISTHWFS